MRRFWRWMFPWMLFWLAISCMHEPVRTPPLAARDTERQVPLSGTLTPSPASTTFPAEPRMASRSETRTVRPSPLPETAPALKPGGFAVITPENVRFIEPVAMVTRGARALCFVQERLAVQKADRITIYDAPAFYERLVLDASDVRAMVCAPQGTWLATVGGPEEDGWSVVWRSEDGQSLARLDHVWGQVGWAERGNVIAVLREDEDRGELVRWTPPKKMDKVVDGLGSGLLTVARNGRYALLQNGEIWSLVEGVRVYEAGRVRRGFFASQGAAALLFDEQGWCWWREKEACTRLEGGDEWALLSPDGEGVLWVRKTPERERLLIWQHEDHEQVLWRTSHGRVTAMAFHPRGRMAAVATMESDDIPEIRWWDLTRGEIIGESSAFQNEVQELLFSANGRWLVSAGQDGVLVWGIP